MANVARALLKQVGIEKDIPATTPIGALSGGERQSVAIARAMYFDSELIISRRADQQFGRRGDAGRLALCSQRPRLGPLLYFHRAHNIHHVFQVVDRIVVLRQGRVVADDIDPKETTVAEVEQVITGMAGS